jgi:putative tricarboxylic transport membrane protein
MELMHPLFTGFDLAFSGANAWYGVAGCLLGLCMAVLSGLGPLIAMALLIPITHALAPVTVLILLAGLCAGAQYGRAVRAVFLQGGESGQVGQALLVAAGACFVSGVGVLLGLTVFVFPLADWFSHWGPAEAFSLMVLGLVGTAVLAPGPWLKAVAMAVLGLLLGLAGTQSGWGGLSAGIDLPGWNDGLGLVFMTLGFLGLGETIHQMGRRVEARPVAPLTWNPWTNFAGAWPTRQAWASFMMAWLHRVWHRRGWGSLGLLPLLAWGLPTNALMALLLAAMGLHNLQPGPSLIADHAAWVWGVLASLWMAQGLLLALFMPLMGLCSRLLRVPARWLFSWLLLSCALGVYAINDRAADVWLLGLFGLVGYVFKKLGLAPTPLLLGLILGPLMQDKLHLALVQSKGDASVLLTQPLSATLLMLAAGLLLLASLPVTQRGRWALLRKGF